MRRLLLSAAIAATCIPSALAVEGMWQPAQLPKIAGDLKAHGLKLDPAALTDLTGYPMGAIVSLGGCTASFVSPQGLVVTNHHCAYGALQYNSTPQKNLIEDGFLARSVGEELPGSPDMRVFVTEEIRDVTKEITGGLRDDMAPLDRYKAIEQAIKAQVKGCERDGYRCDVYTFHGGYSYQLIRQLEIKDVRLVYAPPESIGKFGGDIDNWMWPRHTGDFSYLRAYVSKDGKSAEYSKDNVPYQPKHVLKVNPQGLEEGDYVMVVGYPGRTNRYRLAQEVQAAIDWQYPTQIKIYQDSLAIIDAAAKANPEVGVKYANTVAGLNNYLKNFGGQLEGLRRADAVAVKQQQEAQLDAWLTARRDGDAKALAGDIAQLKQVLAGTAATRERDLDLSLLQRSALFSTGLRLTRLAGERAKPDMEREPGYQQRDEARIEGALKQMDRRYDAGVDQQFLTYALLRYVKLPQAQRLPALDAWLGGARDEAAIKAKVAALYAGSKLGDGQARLAYFKDDAKTLAAQEDSMLKLAAALLPQLKTLEDETDTRDGVLSKLRPRYMQAMIAWKDSQKLPVYPDANSSLRVTYGNVQGVAPRDAVSYAPFTHAEGIVEKATGEVPFNAPKAELDAIKAKDFGPYASKKQGTLPVDFLADLDITGGNSGSPALDGNGQLVGLAFDGNWESVSGDWLFNPKLNRSIQVDVRYMLWVMDHLDHADNLLQEMGVGKR
ncbi:S46 family peptidase [Pseudoxanthomonas winnipegensis]|uniref:Dipeptidyl-peptidase n=1 Tax=Pseudoxanthomonas winnipegensis TaxID=2480810 RepID=A0A4Q8LFW1_9GAMM|nr:S46 family peptidase [Pseudoxanthomonas winnipegensis]RZZ81907.1 S46 family peptidase [Pseudoxanthomonas winnipegensis]TAA27773.1 S46 family peptidase [Pseudoxanthomonas winnipegensis]TAA42224.1 S46 family peptidase [Pseudoxanthomonas winnipegensis]TBV72334.1 S46 family peptidase [Pseudoxanthomonas winnipegensis]